MVRQEIQRGRNKKVREILRRRRRSKRIFLPATTAVEHQRGGHWRVEELAIIFFFLFFLFSSFPIPRNFCLNLMSCRISKRDCCSGLA